MAIFFIGEVFIILAEMLESGDATSETHRLVSMNISMNISLPSVKRPETAVVSRRPSLWQPVALLLSSGLALLLAVRPF